MKRTLEDMIDTDQQNYSKRIRIAGNNKVQITAGNYPKLREALKNGQPFELTAGFVVLNINFIKIDSVQEWTLLSDAIATNQSLKTISFHGTSHIPEDCFKLLWNALMANQSVKQVDFYDSHLDLEFSWWSRMIEFTNSIETLNIGNIQLTSAACQLLSKSLAINNSLKNLDMQSNPDIGVEGCKVLSEALKVNKSLECLCLADCNIDDVSCKYLEDAIKANRALSYLDLSSNSFTSIGFTSICNALKHNTTLQALYVSENEIGTEGCEVLIDLFKNNTTLNTLSLARTNMTIEGCEYLCIALSKTKSLSYLDASYNKFGLEGLDTISEALMINRSLTHIECSQEFISSKDGREQNIFKCTQFNKKYLKYNMLERMIIALISIAKRPESYQLFPMEIWLNIFKHVTAPELGSFGNLALNIFQNIDTLKDRRWCLDIKKMF